MNKWVAVLVVLAAALLNACERDGRAPARWAPSLNDTWQWQLAGRINTGYDATVYDIDLFDAPSTIIDALHAQGRRVVCYFSAGSSEDWRPDFGRFDDSDIGHPLEEWPGERWLDTRSLSVREIMRGRLDLARSKGCDGVEPDNVDAYLQHSGFELDASTQLDFNRFLAAEAHGRGLAAGLKNELGQIRNWCRISTSRSTNSASNTPNASLTPSSSPPASPFSMRNTPSTTDSTSTASATPCVNLRVRQACERWFSHVIWTTRCGLRVAEGVRNIPSPEAVG